MSHLHEPAETFLGVSVAEPNGKGVGAKQARQLVRSIRSSKAYVSGVLSDLSEMALFVDRVGRDKISDLTTNIIRSKLIEYTNQQCRIYNIPVDDYNGPPMWDGIKKNWVNRTVKLPSINGVTVMLIPKLIVRRELSLNSQEFYNKQITDFLIAEHERGTSSLVQTLRAPPKITKGEIREKNPKSKEMLANTVAEHPHLLEMYKDLARIERRAMVNIANDDISVAQACVDLEKALQATSVGAKDADRYHVLAMHALTLCFFPKLVQPRKEWEINDGRKRVDIVYTNAADEGFFGQRRDDKNTSANTVIVECKNYANDISNPEIDQLLGRFDDNRGYFGLLLCRKIDNEVLVKSRCRDLARSRRAYILVLDDNSVFQMLDARKMDDEARLEGLLYSRFRDIIA